MSHSRSAMLATLGMLVALLGSARSTAADRTPAPPASNQVTATLTGAQQVPAILTLAGGSFTGQIELASMSYNLTYGDVEGGAVTEVHIHVAQSAVRGALLSASVAAMRSGALGGGFLA
jgi:hypothetical protein